MDHHHEKEPNRVQSSERSNLYNKELEVMVLRETPLLLMKLMARVWREMRHPSYCAEVGLRETYGTMGLTSVAALLPLYGVVGYFHVLNVLRANWI